MSTVADVQNKVPWPEHRLPGRGMRVVSGGRTAKRREKQRAQELPHFSVSRHSKAAAMAVSTGISNVKSRVQGEDIRKLMVANQ